MPRVKINLDHQQEESALIDSVGSSTFIVDHPPENGTELQSMMAPIRRRHPPTIIIVLEAIKSLDDKKGSTYVAIKNWIMANYPEFNRNRLKFMITKALDKGVKESKIRRKAGDVEHLLTVGRYKIVDTATTTKKAKTSTEVKKNKTPKPAGDAQAASSEKITKKLPVKKQVKQPKSSKNIGPVASLSDTEADAAKSADVPVARRRRSVSESAASKVAKKETKKSAPPKSGSNATQKKSSASAKSAKASQSSSDTAAKKPRTASKKKTVETTKD